jgi:hypothetical protein
VLDHLGGYDEELTYEDFDFWVRSARICHYAFLDENLTRIRKLRQSMSTGQYTPGDRQLHSTYLVCLKAQQLNRDNGDHKALVKRVRYEFRQSVLSENYTEAELFFSLLKKLDRPGIGDALLLFANHRRWRLAPLRRLYHTLRYS